MSALYRILVVDDDRQMRESLEHLLQNGGFEVDCLSRADAVLDRLLEQDFDVLLCDVRMPGMTGLELQEELREKTALPFVLMSAHGDIAMAVEAIQNGAYSFLEKPFDPHRLLKLLDNAAKMHRLTTSTQRLRDRLADLSGLDRVLIGKSEAIVKLREEIVDLSSTEANVMIIGETGTGKELVARALHDLGTRAAEQFVAINCAAVPVTKFEETLFGVAGKERGLLGRAEGGTLFIDELGAIPLESQAKMLRLIETKQYTPVDTADVRAADIRIVSAGNEKLEQMVADGEFRQDLYFRLNTVVLSMPPLRDRGEDVALLYTHYLAQFAATYETDLPNLSSDDIALLMSHDWPGNVRELRNASERHILATRRGTGSVRDALREDLSDGTVPETLREAVAAFERQLISKALVRHEGRMDDVAAALGIGRRTLNEKIVKLGLDKSKLLSD